MPSPPDFDDTPGLLPRQPSSETPIVRMLLLAYAGATGIVAVSAGLARLVDRSFSFVAREPASALEIEGCSGPECGAAGFMAVSGSLIWYFGAIVALLAAHVLRGVEEHRDRRRTLLLGGALTAVMVLDDIFLLHDYVLSELITDYVQAALSAAYGLGAALLALLVLRARDLTALALVVLATGLLGMSVANDLFWEEGPAVVEDGLKLFGIVTWTVFLVHLARAPRWLAPAS